MASFVSVQGGGRLSAVTGVSGAAVRTGALQAHRRFSHFVRLVLTGEFCSALITVVNDFFCLWK